MRPIATALSATKATTCSCPSKTALMRANPASNTPEALRERPALWVFPVQALPRKGESTVSALVVSIVAVLVSLVPVGIAYMSGRRSRMPVLQFMWEGGQEGAESPKWWLVNVGAGPATNVLVAQAERTALTRGLNGEQWFNPVLVPSIPPGGKLALTWLGGTMGLQCGLHVGRRGGGFGPVGHLVGQRRRPQLRRRDVRGRVLVHRPAVPSDGDGLRASHEVPKGWSPASVLVGPRISCGFPSASDRV